MKKVKTLKRDNFSQFDLYDLFLAKSSIDRFQKILARYEIFKMAIDIPGHIVECGVFKGSGIYTWAKLQKIFQPNSDRKIFGFDFFGEERNTVLKNKADKKILSLHSSGWSPKTTILKNLKKQAIDNVHLFEGDIKETTKSFAKKNIGARISILYLDLDVYEPTLAALENLYPLVSTGGIVVFDEYAYEELGESNACDEYFANKNIKLKAFPWAKTPTAYLIK